MAMTVLLVDAAERDFSVRPELVSKLAGLGVTRLELVRDGRTLGIVLEGWMFDPETSADAAAKAVAGHAAARALRPVLHLSLADELAKGA